MMSEDVLRKVLKRYEEIIVNREITSTLQTIFQIRVETIKMVLGELDEVKL